MRLERAAARKPFNLSKAPIRITLIGAISTGGRDGRCPMSRQCLLTLKLPGRHVIRGASRYSTQPTAANSKSFLESVSSILREEGTRENEHLHMPGNHRIGGVSPAQAGGKRGYGRRCPR